MGNNITMTLNIYCETDSEFSKSLISTLNICNDEVNKAHQVLTNEKTEHGKTKDTLNQERTEHGKTKDALNQERTEHGKTKDALNQERTEHGKTKDTLNQERTEHGKTKEVLNQERTEHGKTKETLNQERTEHGKTQETLNQERIEHGKTKEALNQERTEHGKTQETLNQERIEHGKTKEVLNQERKEHDNTKNELSRYTSNLFDVITNQFDEICSLLEENIDSYNNKKLQEYVLSIINQNKGGWSECNSIDGLLHNLKVGSGAICRVANLIWWSKQENLQYMMSMVNNIYEIESKMRAVSELLKVTGHTIKYPTSVLSNSVPNYISYDDERSNFIDIFSSENYDNGVLCEIRLLSIDDSEGKMYIYYK